jgi:hypothetical protein
MDYADYFHATWNEISESIVTEEYYDKNQELFEAVTFDFFQFHSDGGNFPPVLAKFAIERMISGMLCWGIR